MKGYERLGVLEFGRHLLDTGDLDPVYIALIGPMPEKTIRRWLVAYWCFYHCGLASYIAEKKGGAFWDLMVEAAANERPAPTGGRWPRGKERRHFRGAKAIDSVLSLARQYPTPEDMTLHLQDAGTAYKAVADRAQGHVGFGPWIAFKIADMLERVLLHPVNFDCAAVFMFDTPREAARIVWDEYLAEEYGQPTSDMCDMVTAYVAGRLSDRLAPPWYDRPVGLQEVETILCKWKSHRSGHYPLRNDIHEIRQGVEPWLKHSDLAQAFLRGMPE